MVFRRLQGQAGIDFPGKQVEKVSSPHHLALAGLLAGIDHFTEENFLKDKKPLFPIVSQQLNEEEKDNIKNIINLLKPVEKYISGKINSNTSLLESPLESLNENWLSLKYEEIDKFLLEFKRQLSQENLLPYCLLVSALSACGEYPFLLGGRIVRSLDYITSFVKPSPFEGEILSGRIIFNHILTHILPIFEARSFPVPATCIIKVNESEFYAFLPGIISSRGEQLLKNLNNRLWEERYGEICLSWEGIEFSLDQLPDLNYIFIELDKKIKDKSMNIFSKFLLEEGKCIFPVDFQEKICPFCTKRSRYNNIHCPVCDKEINLSKKSGLPIYFDISYLARGKNLLELIKENKEEEILSYEKGQSGILPLFYPLLPEKEDERRIFCSSCILGENKKFFQENQCQMRKTIGLSCMSELSSGKKMLFFAELNLSSFNIAVNECINELYKSNFFMELSYYLMSEAFISDFCSSCPNKTHCLNSIRCLSFFNISTDFLWIIGAWDKVLSFIKLLLLKFNKKVYGKLELFSYKDKLFSIIRKNSSLLNYNPIQDYNSMDIFGCNIKSSDMERIIKISGLLTEALEKGDIDWKFIDCLYKCRPLAEKYFKSKDYKGLKFLPIMSYAIQKYVLSESLREELEKFLELDEEKSLSPSMNFIIEYIHLSEREKF